ncbi:PHB depolymerase family esterase, partial [Streptomyces achromogenes]|uniref:extracellular catalytic domain type 1 short-chain-length polyhydroxyalkanoate depolymerase n=1 Tax=Streptomyces achromogenes TaxID=67255 RepID=UPI0033E02314
MPLPPLGAAPGARPRTRPLSRFLPRLLAVLAVVLGTALVAPAPEARAAVTLTRVSDFGSNPGALTMYVYRPATLPAHPAVVVALHGCTQNAQVYADNSGLPRLADQDGFLLVLAETGTANNVNKCFNWFQSGDNRRGQGEALSVRQMVSHAVTAYGADPGRVYVTGLSAGGAMTAVMLATYPDVFSAGAVVAGLPYAPSQARAMVPT